MTTWSQQEAQDKFLAFNGSPKIMGVRTQHNSNELPNQPPQETPPQVAPPIQAAGPTSNQNLPVQLCEPTVMGSNLDGNSPHRAIRSWLPSEPC